MAILIVDQRRGFCKAPASRCVSQIRMRPRIEVQMGSNGFKCGQVRSSAVKRNLISVLFLLGVCFLWVTAGGCGKDKKNDDDLVGLLVLSTVLNPAFLASCGPYKNICVNYYGVAGNCPVALSSTKCTAGTSNFGSCRNGTSESVYYPGNETCASVNACMTRCATISGVFTATYTP